MSSDTVITVENLGKKYRIQHQQQGGMRYKALRDVLTDRARTVVRGPWSRIRRLWSAIRSPSALSSLPSSRSASEDFWALKDVSFEVRQGETLGIIGRNGAGKSTLLKILSRITEPTEGRVRIKGRVASLLEVGTGFHPELTGRENIFLNGAILGMTRVEIKTKFDEIVAFAEVEKFLDTPVKRYSSGMYVRLAFAVAAHLEPEILIVDEVLAVGDAQFQKKCLGKMEEVSVKQGRTVLFVSHNMAALQSLCSRALLLTEGRKVFEGIASEAVEQHLRSAGSGQTNVFDAQSKERHGSQQVEILSIFVSPVLPRTGEGVVFIFELLVREELDFELALGFSSLQGTPLWQVFSNHSGESFRLPPGKHRIQVEAECLPLVPGTYKANAWAGMGSQPLDWIKECLTLEVSGWSKDGGGQARRITQYPCFVPMKWSGAKRDDCTRIDIPMKG